MRVRGCALVRHCSGLPASAAQVILAMCDGQTDLQCADDCVTDLSAIIVLWYDQSTMILGKMGSSVVPGSLFLPSQTLFFTSQSGKVQTKSLATPKVAKVQTCRWHRSKQPFQSPNKVVGTARRAQSPHIVGGTLKVAQAHT